MHTHRFIAMAAPSSRRPHVQLTLLLVLAAAATTTRAASAVDIVGIPPAAASVFGAAKQQGTFACLTDKKKVIPFDKVRRSWVEYLCRWVGACRVFWVPMGGRSVRAWKSARARVLWGRMCMCCLFYVM